VKARPVGAGDDHDAHLVVLVAPLVRGPEALAHRAGERVPRRGTVERHDGHPVAHAQRHVEQVVVSHHPDSLAG